MCQMLHAQALMLDLQAVMLHPQAVLLDPQAVTVYLFSTATTKLPLTVVGLRMLLPCCCHV